MDRAKFFLVLQGAFGGPLNEGQVLGIAALLDAGEALSVEHMANVLANVRRETGGIMSPIKETVMANHKDKNPSDTEVIRRLDRAFTAGQLTWVKTPYWRGGEFGRGQIQVTHESNRLKFGITNRDDLLKLDVSARVAVRGMVKGMFTGKKLDDYKFPEALNNPPSTNPRRIVNGKDGSDTEVAKFHRQFVAALREAGWSSQPTPKPLISAPVPVSVGVVAAGGAAMALDIPDYAKVGLAVVAVALVALVIMKARK